MNKNGTVGPHVSLDFARNRTHIGQRFELVIADIAAFTDCGTRWVTLAVKDPSKQLQGYDGHELHMSCAQQRT